MAFQDVFAPSQVTKARTAQGVSAESLAHAMGLREDELLDLEAGRRPPTNAELLALSDALGRELPYFAHAFRGTALDGCVAVGGEALTRPLDEEMVRSFHTALDRGHVTQRKAARLLGLTLDELDILFSSRGMRDPIRTFADTPAGL